MLLSPFRKSDSLKYEFKSQSRQLGFGVYRIIWVTLLEPKTYPEVQNWFVMIQTARLFTYV